jgi:hypothetical protein
LEKQPKAVMQLSAEAGGVRAGALGGPFHRQALLKISIVYGRVPEAM